MSDQTPNAFENNQQQETPAPQPDTSSAFVDQLKQIKNESGEQKYDSVPKALDALAHSQSFISQLKQETASKDAELQALKEELAKREAVGDVVEKLTAQQAQPEPTPQVSGLDEQKAVELFNQLTAQQQATQVAQSNEAAVSNALFEKFGEKTSAAVSNKAAELGMTVEGLKQLAQSSPQAALQLFQVQASTAPKTTTGSYSIPPTSVQVDEVAPPEKSLLRGASTNEQIEYLRKIRQNIYNKHGIEN